ncbi:unnamed protein product [Ectocarpus sp. 8 AP-2014]
MLTQIDNLREGDNILVLTTLNVSEAIDLASVDRADIKQCIGLPTSPARYQDLHSCPEELVRARVEVDTPFPEWGIISPPSHLPPSYSKAVELTAGAAGGGGGAVVLVVFFPIRRCTAAAGVRRGHIPKRWWW